MSDLVKVQEVAQELDFIVGKTYASCAELSHPVLGEITISYADNTHFKILQRLPVACFEKFPQSIRISKAKDPLKIADEIRTRFLSEYTPIWQKAKEQQKQHEEYVNNNQQKIQKLKETYPNAKIRNPDSENPTIHLYEDQGNTCVTIRSTSSGYHIDGYLSDQIIQNLFQSLKIKQTLNKLTCKTSQ